MREPEASGKIGLGLSIASHSGLPPSRIGGPTGSWRMAAPRRVPPG